MHRRVRVAAIVLATLAAAPPALAHEGNPDFRSRVTRVVPMTQGITVDVLNYDDRLLIRNTSDREVVIHGYRGEPYARLRPDGTVEVNLDSQAHYLNDDRFADVRVPAAADSEGAPRWRQVGANGRFEWHDHRAHWMSRSTPPQVTDPDLRTKVFDWKVPMEVDGRAGAIAGSLFWTPPEEADLPLGAIFALGGLVIAMSVGVVLVRRRPAPAPAREEPEAW